MQSMLNLMGAEGALTTIPSQAQKAEVSSSTFLFFVHLDLFLRGEGSTISCFCSMPLSLDEYWMQLDPELVMGS